jgi:hypothetical protein
VRCSSFVDKAERQLGQSRDADALKSAFIHRRCRCYQTVIETQPIPLLTATAPGVRYGSCVTSAA